MLRTDKNSLSQNFVYKVKHVITAKIDKIASFYKCTIDSESLMPGKMLRTQLASQLIAYDTEPSKIETLVHACAATELVHTASLCHDDVIDNGLIRRGFPTIWKATGFSGAVLTGDLLLCDAIDILQNTAGGSYVSPFISKVKEVCKAEIEQEILLRGKQLDEPTCINIARRKTGPLFAFIGFVSGGSDSVLSSALEEAGYHIGTAYQLADDLLDIVGDESLSGKTLGSDIERGKFTIPQFSVTQCEVIYENISELCLSALNCLNEWPQFQKRLEKFFENDLQPYFDKIDIGINISYLADDKLEY